jgi:hypothetical protein
LKLSKETNFIERARKITPVSMIESILFANQDPSKVSLNDMAIYHKLNFGISLTRQAIAKRFSLKSTMFVKTLFAQMLKSSLLVGKEIFAFTDFNRVLIKDSTCNQLPGNLKEYYPGTGGASTGASVRVQFEYDLKNQEVLELKPTAFNIQDVKDAKDTLDNIQPNDLIIRDLGYISTDVLKGIESKKAWYISRLNNSTDVYDRTGEIIDFCKIEEYLRKHNIYIMEKLVSIGSKRLASRLVIELVPDQVKEERIRKAKRKIQRSGSNTSKKSMARLGLNLFLTNCSQTMISASDIRKIYGIRWQIELVFKAWKQNIQFHKIKKMDIHRYEFLLYVKLIMVLLTWRLYQSVDSYLFQTYLSRTSILKFYKTLTLFSEELKGTIRGQKESPDKLISNIITIGKRYLLHDDRKGRINWRNVKNI